MSKSSRGTPLNPPLPIDLGALQLCVIKARKAEGSAERALQRAQETRDRARAQRAEAERALGDGFRGVIG